MKMLLPRPPASIKQTEILGSSLNLDASVDPADPPPIITKSYSIPVLKAVTSLISEAR